MVAAGHKTPGDAGPLFRCEGREGKGRLEGVFPYLKSQKIATENNGKIITTIRKE